MPQLTLRISDCTPDASCSMCHRPLPSVAGPCLSLHDGSEPVCRDCGRQHARPLAALLDLARVAQRVGPIGRHTVVPPMGALLDLAHAAEQYAFTASEPPRKAA